MSDLFICEEADEAPHVAFFVCGGEGYAQTFGALRHGWMPDGEDGYALSAESVGEAEGFVWVADDMRIDVPAVEERCEMPQMTAFAFHVHGMAEYEFRPSSHYRGEGSGEDEAAATIYKPAFYCVGA